MAKYDNLAGTTETSFGIGTKALRGLLRSAFLTTARVFDLPDRDGTFSLDEPGFIRGFSISTPGNCLISAGAAYVESVARVVRGNAISIATGLTIGEKYHAYLSSTGVVSLSTTVPNPTPYAGTARSMTGNTAQRWLGAVYCQPTGIAFLNCTHDGGGNCVTLMFRGNTGASPFRIISAGNSTTAADVNLVNFAPPNATVSAHVRIGINSATTGQILRLYGHDGSAFAIYANQPALAASVLCSQTFYGVNTDATPKLQYDVPSGGNTAFVDLLGYTFTR